MRNALVIFKKQLKDTLKNKTVLIQFIMFPLMTLVMENAITLPDIPELFFTKLFSVMYIGMAPVTAAAAIISEEKEKNTLRVLMMANIKPWEYLLGVGAYVWTLCMAGAGIMATGLASTDIPFYLGVMAAGFVVSIAIGACIGIFSSNQMTATSLFVPVMMVFSFSPMLAMFNDKIEKVARVFYTQQLRVLMNQMSFEGIKTESILILVVNAVLAVVLFFAAFRKKGLE